MDMTTFMRSLFALRGYFSGSPRPGPKMPDFGILQALGIAAERRMLTATGGVNTHRGADILPRPAGGGGGVAACAGLADLPARSGKDRRRTVGR